MLASAPLLAETLLLERRGADPAAVDAAVASGGFGPRVPPEEEGLLLAASALAAGEPKRAERLLAGVPASEDAAAVVGALRVAAHSLDRNWFPGGAGAILVDGDAASAPAAYPSPSDPGAMLVAAIAGSLLPGILSWRSIVASAINSGRGDMAAQGSTAFEALAPMLQQLGHRPTSAYHALLAADLRWRAGAFDKAAELLGAARTSAPDDLLGLAAGTLIQGDWESEPRSSPELLGMRLEGEQSALPVERDPVAARALYEDALGAYRTAGVVRGQCAATLRLAHVAALQGRMDECELLLGEAAALAERAGDRGTLMLVRTHAALAAIERDRDVSATALDEVARWALADGSTAFARGLCRLVGARSYAWRRDGEFVRARVALRLAERLAAGVGERVEQELVGSAVGELYGMASYPRASYVLNDLDLARRLAGFAAGGDPDPLAWLSLVDRGVALFRDSVAMRDGELVALAGSRLADVLELQPQPDPGPAGGLGIDVSEPSMNSATMLAVARAHALACAQQCAVLAPLYSAGAAGLAGRPDEEARGLAEAEAALSSVDPESAGLMRCIVLQRLGRAEEALAVAVEEDAAGRLPPDLAVELYLRLGAPERAAGALDQLDATGPPDPTARPWEDPARRLELADALGRADAVEHAERALARFEDNLVRMGRDVLRSSATDVPLVAGMYLHAATARLTRAEQARQRGDAGAERSELELGFAVSDRGRAIALATVAGFDDADLSLEGRRTVRQWLRSGSRWAAAFERLTQLVDEPGAAPERLRDDARVAETELDEAEVRLARVAPDFFARRRTPPAPSDVTRLRALLPADALLLHFHAFEDDLLTWALDRADIRARRERYEWRRLAGTVRQFHAACSGGGDDRGAGALLARLLLEPWADAIGAHERILVATGGALSMLPFHLLPWEGDLLGSKLPVSYLPAASLVTRWGEPREPRLDGGALIVGDPAYGPGHGLRRLPGTRTEALALGTLLGAEPLVGPAATEAAVGAAATGARVLHLATHGLLYEREPNRNSLALAGEDELTVGDLLGLELAADLVVLSACHTGHSTATLGGDLVGLTRALVVAGARHVVVSLWPVDDEAGALIMHRFYERLSAGEGVAAALRAAQADVRELDAAGRAGAYESLRARVGGEQAARGARDVDPLAPREGQATAPADWAPFIHVGV